ncbi:MAG: hypothetical protein PHP85_01935 [Gallionella sp.]|nr:hypothetical protein [Gallionella sp.]
MLLLSLWVSGAQDFFTQDLPDRIVLSQDLDGHPDEFPESDFIVSSIELVRPVLAAFHYPQPLTRVLVTHFSHPPDRPPSVAI